MRLIDADLLMEKLNGIWDCNDMTFAPVDGCCIDADCKSCRWRETIEYVKRLVQNQPTASPWHRVEERPDEYKNLWLHDERGNYHVGCISTYRGYTEYIDMDGNTLHDIDYWMPIEPPKEEE